jgi:hypothetical protein
VVFELAGFGKCGHGVPKAESRVARLTQEALDFPRQPAHHRPRLIEEPCPLIPLPFAGDAGLVVDLPNHSHYLLSDCGQCLLQLFPAFSLRVREGLSSARQIQMFAG